jgi:ERCC4-type nuclease
MNEREVVVELKFVNDFSGTIKDGTICKDKFTIAKQKNPPLHTIQGKNFNTEHAMEKNVIMCNKMN